MKVLFVSMVAFENNTSATIQNKGIVKGLFALGHDVDIMTLTPNQSTISYDNTMNDINFLIKNRYYIDMDSKYEMLMAKKNKSSGTSPKLNENKNPLIYILKKGRSIIKAVYDNTFIFDAQKVNVKQVSKVNIDYNEYDIIISASDPKSSHLLVERIFTENKGCKAKWIQYWGDPFLNDITRKSDWRNSLVKYYENRLIVKANKVVYASPITLNTQKETFPKQAYKMTYASQAYANEQQLLNKNKVIKKDQHITMGYFGAFHSRIRNIIPLYNTVRECNDIKLNICGSSDLTLSNTKNISVDGMVSYKEVVEMEENSDILVCICNRNGTQIPGKIYYCTSYQKPIIVILDSEFKDELREYFKKFNRFILCENEEKSIKDAIVKARNQLKTVDYGISELLTPEYMVKKIL
ncbi:hypothetical protein [Pseudalkalibacillus berkeleyi]|uniref:Uncharacterized protein n=1 Tax=Pseudalkalibacillus berkeleyi TaxID=1069813 RepID=A0ABS9H1L3_9BACL|nr:hypothetical protein [Pseudalkalibacillus berkeleyi]MCF6138819.1 hypothetical protein [Pseudalkalibacillus berkeleyi]